MKALVTGAGGFVGANLVRYLLDNGHQPVATIRPGGNSWRLDGTADSAVLIDVDLSDTAAIERAVLEQAPDVIFHLGAYGAYSWQRDFDLMLAVNVRATEALLSCARAVGARLVHAGSSSEYGYRDHAPTEGDHLAPNSHYAVTKAAATHLCRLAAAEHGQHAITVRLYSVYGPWEDPGRLIPTLVGCALKGRLPPLVDPATARDFVWVDDVCVAFLKAARAELSDPGAVFNIATGRQTTLGELVELTRELFAINAKPEWGTMAPRAWDTSTWVGDPTLAHEALRWRATTPLGSGLERMAQWMRMRSAAMDHSRT